MPEVRCVLERWGAAALKGAVAFAVLATPFALQGQALGTALAADSVAVVGGSASATLSSASHAIFDGADRLFVLDFRDLRVVQHSGPAFRSATSMGRGGAGPGEFRSFSELGWKLDTLWVFDAQLERTSFFIKGRLVRTEQYDLPRPPGYAVAQPLSFSASSASLGVARFARGTQDGRAQQGYLLYRFAPRTRTLDTIRWLSRRRSELRVPVVFRGSNATVQAEQPLTDDPLLVARPRGGVVVVERDQRAAVSSARIRVVIHAPDGAVAAEHSLTVASRPLSRAVRNDVSALLCAPLGSDAAMPQCAKSELERALYFPSFVPAATAITPCDDGEYWLRLAEWPRSSPVRFVRLGADARPTGWLDLPASTKILACAHDRIATTLTEGRESLLPIVIRRVSPSVR